MADDLRVLRFTQALRVLAEIRDGIVEATGCTVIPGIVDVPLITKLLEHSSYSWEDLRYCVGLVFDVIKAHQAPARASETCAKWGELMSRIGDWTLIMCDGLEFLLGRVNVMRIDAANAR